MHAQPRSPRLILKADRLDQRRHDAGIATDHQFSDLIGMHQSRVSRILRGEEFGLKFVVGVLAVFGPEAFTDLFDLVGTRRTRRSRP